MDKTDCKKCGKKIHIINSMFGYCSECWKIKQRIPVPKAKIPSRLRQEVWETNIGDKFWGNCFVCNMRINVLEFACGHIVSEFTGGKMVLENMKVVCKSCNSKMGTRNLLEFKAKRYGGVPDIKKPEQIQVDEYGLPMLPQISK